MKFASMIVAATLASSALFAATETLTFTSKSAITAGAETAVKTAAAGATVTLDKAKNTLTVTGANEKTVPAIKKAAAAQGLTAAAATATTTTSTGAKATDKASEPAAK